MSKSDMLWPAGGYALRMKIKADTEEEADKLAQKLANQLRTEVTVLRSFTGHDYVPYKDVTPVVPYDKEDTT